MATRKASFKTALTFHNRALSLILAQLHKQQQLLIIIRSSLPENMAPHAIDCTIKEDKLIVYTDSAAWASQLRFYNASILSTIQSKYTVTITRIQFRVLQHQPSLNIQKKQRQANLPSAKSIALMQDNIIHSEDSRLKEALLKLSTKLKQLHETGGRS